MIGNHLTQHPDLPLLAIGLACHIQSLPKGARVDIKTLTARFPEGATRIAAALRELEAHGYLRRERARVPGGRIVTRTISCNQPVARCHHPDRPSRPTRRPTGPATAPAKQVFEGEGRHAGSDWHIRATADASEACTKPSETARIRRSPNRPDGPTVRPAAHVPLNLENPAERPPRTAPKPLPAVPQPACTAPALLQTATGLLADLRRLDPGLLLSEQDTTHLAPGVAAWLERDVSPTAVRQALTTDLPPEGPRRPAALLAHRLATQLPPPPPFRAPAAPPAARHPLQTCDGCDRAFRAPGPGRCRDCRSDLLEAA
ncbi:helix-turn-helix domain-containing protein [Streptomyces lasalocidi]